MRLLFGLFAFIAAPLSAQTLDGKSAERMLFSTRGYSVVTAEELSDKDARTVEAILPLMAEQMRQPVLYYAAIAYSPDDGLVHDALQAAMNHHTPEAAEAAALAACDRLKSAGARPCRVAARIFPKSYENRPLTLSVQASEAVKGAYRKMRGTKAFAIAPETGGWGIGASEAAAISECERRAPNSVRCRVVIQD